MSDIKWAVVWDESGNDTWEFCPGCLDNPDACYRINQTLQCNKIYYIEASDKELIMDPRDPKREIWYNIWDAKRDLETVWKKRR